MAKIDDQKRAELVERFTKTVPAGAELMFVCTHTARGGMTHGFRVFFANEDADYGRFVQDITYWVGALTGHYSEKAQEIRIGGTGYSKPNHIWDSLRAVLGAPYNDSTPGKRGRYKGLNYTSA